MLKYGKSIVKTVGLVALVGLLTIKVISCADKVEEEHIQSIKNYEVSDRLDMFEKYNKEYKIADTQMKKVVVGVYGDVNYSFDIINNYISNVQGEILKKEIGKDEYDLTITYFTLNIPLNAKYIDRLQEEIDMYWLYDFLANEKYRSDQYLLGEVNKRYLRFKDMQVKAGIWKE